ncbi:MAG: acyl-CoA dehydrogenase [Acidobacteriota bacterium]|jgi:alkylation response protein AidB-like acyl-CoA dehydrogenase|nr:acyl-CoA dehydrogenase [Acidobacteriota bacterium]
MIMPFRQPPPTLGNQYEDDRTLRSFLARTLPPEILREIEPSLKEMGHLAGSDLYRMQLADRLNEPSLTQWDAWGNRIDHIELTPLWRMAERIAAEHGVVATAYERRHGPFSRVHQCALAYLFTPSTDIYSCPLAMTDGAARTLLSSGNQALVDRAVPHLLTRNAEEFWTSGQWMTEATGGSDVGLSEAVARPDAEGVWRLYGRKWFTSATTSQMALTLARPEGNASGGQGLALFYVETRDAEGKLRNIEINRLKDKLGTRKVPTAELTLTGTPAQLVRGTSDGIRNITPMLNITRLWNGISAVSLMRRGLALAFDYARKRVAFGAPLNEKPLHVDTLAGLQVETEAAFHLAFYVAELTGRSEEGEITEEEMLILRLLTPVMKLTTAKQAVAVASETLEAFGGAGYVEDTGLPQLLRDGQVLPIWEGTTNVLSLDALRALGENGRAFQLLKAEVGRSIEAIREVRLIDSARIVRLSLEHAENWLLQAKKEGQAFLESGARRFALTLGRAMELALLIKHAQWSVDNELDGRATAAARYFAGTGIDLIIQRDMDDARSLLSDQ